MWRPTYGLDREVSYVDRMMNNTTDALTVTCPKCHAEAGSPCITPSGKKSPIHTDRTKAAVEAAAKKRTKRVVTSHADCDHPTTKAARAACRRERANSSKERIADNATDSRKAQIRARHTRKPKQSVEAMQRQMAAGLA